MAIATLTITDTDLDSGQVQIECKIDESKTDDGHMTAAEVMIRVVHAEINTPEFRNKLWARIAEITADSEAKIANDDYNPTKETA